MPLLIENFELPMIPDPPMRTDSSIMDAYSIYLYVSSHILLRHHQDCNHTVVGFTNLQLPVQSVPITIKVVSLNPADGEVC
jgi:hypothetical protein